MRREEYTVHPFCVCCLGSSLPLSVDASRMVVRSAWTAHLGNVGDDLVEDADGDEAAGVAHLAPDLVGERVALVDVEADALAEDEVERAGVRQADHALDNQVGALVGWKKSRDKKRRLRRGSWKELYPLSRRRPSSLSPRKQAPT